MGSGDVYKRQDPDNATVTILEFDGEGMNLIIHLENCLIILLVSN